jgi:nitrate/TMAO reductase-like tetraheme cytochrome c subunit
MLKIAALSLILVSCLSNPQKSGVEFSSPETRRSDELQRQEEERRQEELRQIQFEEEKREAWKGIVLLANESFKEIQPLFSKKCFDCHDSSRRLPFYGRILPRINPVNAHQREGLEALDMVDIFPMKAKGKTDQLSLLKAIKNSAIEKTMPLKSYTFVYRKRKLNTEDQEKIQAWVEPLIEQIKVYRDVYESEFDDGSFRFKARKVFEAKCFRCHANGVSKGGFGEMENLEKLKNSFYVDLEDPEASELYTIVQSGEMPTNPRERLTVEELSYVLEWIKEVN